MEIQLVYLAKTGGNTVRVNSSIPFESIRIVREERQFGPPLIRKIKEPQNCLMVLPDGTASLELTKINATYIKWAMDHEVFDLANPEEQVFLDQMLSGSMPEPKEPEPAAKRGRGRPRVAPVPAAEAPSATTITSA